VVVTLFLLFFQKSRTELCEAVPARAAFGRTALSVSWSRKSGCLFCAEARHILPAIECNRSTRPARPLGGLQ
jgi:hypothetical protein